MRIILIFCFCFIFKFTFGQMRQNADSISRTTSEYSLVNEVWSFSFAGKTFQLPSCKEPQSACCCDFLPTPQVSCRNGTTLSWRYYTDELQAQQEVENWINRSQVIDKKLKKRILTCLLMDQEVKGYQVSYAGRKWMEHWIIAAGKVNGQAVVVRVDSDKELTSGDIPQTIRPILQIKP